MPKTNSSVGANSDNIRSSSVSSEPTAHVRLTDLLSNRTSNSKPKPPRTYASLGSLEWYGLTHLDEIKANEIYAHASRCHSSDSDVQGERAGVISSLALSRAASQLSAAVTLIDYAATDLQEALVNLPFHQRGDVLSAVLKLKDSSQKINSLRVYADYISRGD